MKKFFCILLVILLVFGLAAAGGYAYAWYRNNHIFVDDAVYPKDAAELDLREQDISFEHYETVRSKLPSCKILWNVPFQGSKYPNDITALKVSTFTEEDASLILQYFPGLTKLDASGCTDYALLEAFRAEKPECEVIYQVSLGGSDVYPLDTTELVLENGDYELTALTENLKYLPGVTTITLKMPELTTEQVEELRAAYESIAITCTVELLGREYDNRVTELDLTDLASGDVADVAAKLPLLPGVTQIELMPHDGSASQLSLEDVKTLQAAAPGVIFNYAFDFHGYTLSTADEEVHIKNTKIGDDGLEEVRSVLDLMPNCKRFVLENCQISNEKMAQLREDYRDRTKIVWRVSFGGGSALTDVEVIRCTYDLVDDNCSNLQYCEDVRFMDIGHNEWLDACDFVAGMPKLEGIIVSGAPIKSLEAFKNCKQLKFLEIAFCGYIDDLSPLAECEALEMLNVGETKVADLSALDNLKLTNLCIDHAKVSAEERERFAALQPECWITYDDAQPYNDGWRYDEDGITPLPYYAMLRRVFRYDADIIPNNVGWYLEEGITDLDYSE